MHRIKIVKDWTEQKLSQCAESTRGTDSGDNLETLFQHEFLTGRFYHWLRSLFSDGQQCTLQQALEIEWKQYMKYQCPTNKEAGECPLFQGCTHNDVETK